jgi:transposase
MSSTGILSPVDLPPPSARRVPRPSRGDGWDILADVEVFVFAVEAELEAMERERVGVHRRGRKPDLSLRRRLIGLIWMLKFGGMQWRTAGWLSGIPFTTLHSTFARWSRPGLWRRLGQRLALDWRLAFGDEVLPSAVVVDSRSLRSAPTAWARGIDGGKLVKGIKLCVACDKHGSLLDLELQPANTDDRAGILPTLPRLAVLGFQGDLLDRVRHYSASLNRIAPAWVARIPFRPGPVVRCCGPAASANFSCIGPPFSVEPPDPNN